MLTVYGDNRSGNCLKVKWLLDHRRLDYRWVDVDVMGGGARSPAILALNPAAQVPLVVLDDGRALAQSNALLMYFGEGTPLIPADAYDRARMLEWMFWEQYSHEPYIAVARFQRVYLGKPAKEIDPKLMERGRAALDRMELALTGQPWLAGPAVSLADIALVAYTRVAHEGGFDLAPYPAVSGWVSRVEQAVGIG